MRKTYCTHASSAEPRGTGACTGPPRRVQSCVRGAVVEHGESDNAGHITVESPLLGLSCSRWLGARNCFDVGGGRDKSPDVADGKSVVECREDVLRGVEKQGFRPGRLVRTQQDTVPY